MLTSLHPLTYLSLRNIGSNVRLAGNRWQCDCSVRSLARRMTYDSSIGLQAWGMVCAFPTTLSGKDLLQLEEDDLNCFGTENSPELHRDVTVYSGSGILLSCSKQGITVKSVKLINAYVITLVNLTTCQCCLLCRLLVVDAQWSSICERTSGFSVHQ